MVKKHFGTLIRLLRGDDIVSAVNSGHLYIKPFDIGKIQPTSYDISVFHVIKYKERSFYQANDDEEIIEDFEELILPPNSSYLFLSLEEFCFPLDMIAVISLRSRYSRLFNAAQSMGRIECGWKGRLVLEVSNHSVSRHVKITKGESIATIEVFQLEDAVSKGYSGRYMDWPITSS